MSRAREGMELMVPTVFLLGIVIPAFVVTGVPCLLLGMEAIAAWTIVLYSSVRLGMYAASGRKRLLTLTFWIFVYIFLGLAPMAQALANHRIYSNEYDQHTALVGSMVVWMGIAGYELGVAAGNSQVRPFENLLRPLLMKRVLSHRKVWMLAAAAPVISVAVIHLLGGVRNVFVARQALESNIRSAVGGEGDVRFRLIQTAMRVPPFVALYYVWAECLAIMRRGTKLTIGRKVVVVLLGMINAVVSNPIGSERAWVGTIILSFWFLTFPWKHRWTFAAWAIGIAICFVFVFPYADMFRHHVGGPATRDLVGRKIDWSARSVVQEFTQKPDFSEMQLVMDSVKFVDQRGITMGRQTLGTILFWFPRSKWPGKPIPSGMYIAQATGYGRGRAINLIVWGEAYVEAGIPGVICFFTIYGLLTALLERFYLADSESGIRYGSLQMPVIAGYQILLVRGSLLPIAGPLVGLLAVMIWPTRRASKEI